MVIEELSRHRERFATIARWRFDQRRRLTGSDTVVRTHAYRGGPWRTT